MQMSESNVVQFSGNGKILPIRNRVIALSGWKGSGKDTVADYLVKEYGYIKVSFAAVLKDMVARTYELPRNWLDDRDRKELPLTPELLGGRSFPVIASDPFSEKIHEMLQSELSSGYWTPRALCILEGSVKRAVNSNYWVSRVVDRIHKFPDHKFVISDMRYCSEADQLLLQIPREQLLLWRINRFESIDTLDPSERDLDTYKFDITLGNSTTTVQGLYDIVDWILANLSRKKE